MRRNQNVTEPDYTVSDGCETPKDITYRDALVVMDGCLKLILTSLHLSGSPLKIGNILGSLETLEIDITDGVGKAREDVDSLALTI